MKWFLHALFAVLVLTGCNDRPVAPATGSYGPPTGRESAAVARARPDSSSESSWTNGALSVLQTELSPATLWHSTSSNLSFFANMPQTGIGGPSYVCMSTELGPKIFQHGAKIDPQKMRESWFVVWFAGAANWTNWDSPWFLTLQHRPQQITFDTNGLHFAFSREAGYAALMPMYGYYKPLAAEQGNHPFTKLKEKKKRILTWEWNKALPADPLSRARYWASALREFPASCEDSFSVDRAHDSVVLRQKFHFVSWDDDWKTKHLKLAPISPALALAYLDGFPAEFTKKPFDMQTFTAYGPYFGVEDVEQYDVALPLLRYVNETEVIDGNVTNTSLIVRAALKKLRETVRANLPVSDVHAAQAYAKALPYLEEPARGATIGALKKYFREDLLVTNRLRIDRDIPANSTLGFNALPAIWAYAHFTGDWELVRERWPLIKRLSSTTSIHWAGFGRDSVAELGDEAAPCLAFARLAYKAGDMDSYNYGCQMFVRELAHHWAKQRGAKYFQENQPWHSMEALDDEVYLTGITHDLAGWNFDGPQYPASARERHFERRWVRFNNEDVARVYRDYLSIDVRTEMDLLRSRWPVERRASGEAGWLPSLVQLRSLLLNESPQQLASNAVPEQFSGSPAGVIASCAAILRTSHPTRYERLIPGGEASSFIESEIAEGRSALDQSLVVSNWTPRLTWPSWKTPTGTPWHFGEVLSGTNGTARAEPKR